VADYSKLGVWDMQAGRKRSPPSQEVARGLEETGLERVWRFRGRWWAIGWHQTPTNASLVWCIQQYEMSQAAWVTPHGGDEAWRVWSKLTL